MLNLVRALLLGSFTLISAVALAGSVSFDERTLRIPAVAGHEAGPAVVPISPCRRAYRTIA